MAINSDRHYRADGLHEDNPAVDRYSTLIRPGRARRQMRVLFRQLSYWLLAPLKTVALMMGVSLSTDYYMRLEFNQQEALLNDLPDIFLLR